MTVLKHFHAHTLHTQRHTVHTLTQKHAAQVLDSCHTHSDFWLVLLWVTCTPAELCGGVQPVYRGLCKGLGGVGYCTLSLH